MDSSNNLWIADFGLARLRNRQQDVTQTAGLHGTLCYMSPEQVSQGKLPLDRHTDIYSLGVTMYELMTLRLPFDDREADQCYDEALKAAEELVSAVPESGWGRDLARALMHEAEVEASQRGLVARPSIEPLYRRSVEILEKLAAQCPLVPEYRVFLGIRYDRYGSMLVQAGRLPEAETHYRKAITTHERLLSEFPSVPEHRERLAVSLDELADMLQRLGRNDEAEQSWRRAIQLREQLVAHAPQIPNHRRSLAQDHVHLAEFLEAKGRETEADGHLRRARELDEPCLQFATDAMPCRYSPSPAKSDGFRRGDRMFL